MSSSAQSFNGLHQLGLRAEEHHRERSERGQRQKVRNGCTADVHLDRQRHNMWEGEALPN